MAHKEGEKGGEGNGKPRQAKTIRKDYVERGQDAGGAG